MTSHATTAPPTNHPLIGYTLHSTQERFLFLITIAHAHTHTHAHPPHTTHTTRTAVHNLLPVVSHLVCDAPCHWRRSRELPFLIRGFRPHVRDAVCVYAVWPMGVYAHTHTHANACLVSCRPDAYKWITFCGALIMARVGRWARNIGLELALLVCMCERGRDADDCVHIIGVTIFGSVHTQYIYIND